MTAARAATRDRPQGRRFLVINFPRLVPRSRRGLARGLVATVVLSVVPLLGIVPDASGIVNGGTEVTAVGSWPWMVGIVIQNESETVSCSGAMIGPTTVLTAAHCVDPTELGFVPTPSEIVVTSARTLFSDPQSAYVGVTSFTENPEFDISNLESGHDEAILQLSATPAGTVPLAVLQPDDVGPFGQQFDALVAGYGETVPDNYNSAGLLYQTAVPDAVYGSPVITATTDPSYTCNGDSGGPLIVNLDGVAIGADPTPSNGSWAIIGLTSYGYSDCQSDDGFTNAMNDYAFIAANDSYISGGPFNTVAPAVSAAPFVGSPLTCNAGGWQAGTAFTYQWLRTGTSGALLPGANSSTYTPDQSDLSTTIACEVHATLSGATVTADSASVTVAATVPGTPTIASVVAGSRRATVSFVSPVTDGGNPISSFRVTATPGNITATGLASPLVVSGLTNGKHYSFTVSAINGLGTGPASSQSANVTPRAPKRAVLSLRSARLVDSKGTVAVALRCRNANCSGSLRLEESVVVRIRKGSSTKLTTQTELLAARGVAVAENGLKTVVLSLNALGVRTLAHAATHANRGSLVIDIAGRKATTAVVIT